ncbi:hypothetical protein niasHT_037450 [Heterodera trifolii]|uniref:4Fe-4S ferredoxin-type domain-containing protein n=1 Tax=Heterodera trifolii TaxID=157864 RepID=A0ABD2IEI9_9BILA
MARNFNFNDIFCPVCCDPCSIKYWDCKTKCETDDPENMACEPNCTFALDKCAKSALQQQIMPTPEGQILGNRWLMGRGKAKIVEKTIKQM